MTGLWNLDEDWDEDAPRWDESLKVDPEEQEWEEGDIPFNPYREQWEEDDDLEAVLDDRD